jgi:spermidine/putrescine transport system permease protein
MPEIVLGVAMFMVVALIPKFIPLGTWAQIVELVTYQLSYPVIMVRARMLSIGKEYEEAAIDLGAPPRAAIRRILLPLQSPEIFASFAIAFGSPTPAVNAAATFLLVTTTVAIVLGYFLYRRAARAQRTAGVSEFANV